jgi:hypothetical protein
LSSLCFFRAPLQTAGLIEMNDEEARSANQASYVEQAAQMLNGCFSLRKLHQLRTLTVLGTYPFVAWTPSSQAKANTAAVHQINCDNLACEGRVTQLRRLQIICGCDSAMHPASLQAILHAQGSRITVCMREAAECGEVASMTCGDLTPLQQSLRFTYWKNVHFTRT